MLIFLFCLVCFFHIFVFLVLKVCVSAELAPLPSLQEPAVPLPLSISCSKRGLPTLWGPEDLKHSLESDIINSFLLRERSSYILGTRGFKQSLESDITNSFLLQEGSPYIMGTRGFKQSLESDINVHFLLQERTPYIIVLSPGSSCLYFSPLFVFVLVPFTLSVSYLLKFSFPSRVVPPLTGARPVHRVLTTAFELTVRHQAACHLTLKDLH